MPQHRIWLPLTLASLFLCPLLTGCITRHTATTTQPSAVDAIDPLSGDPAYWYAKPAVVTVSADNYDALLNYCQTTLKARRFDIDRTDYRSGIIRTRPMISKQFWEIWRGDVITAYDLEKSSLATYRRTVRWQITKSPSGPSGPSGQFDAQPWVLVEHFTASPTRITSVTGTNSSLSSAETVSGVSPDTLQIIGNQYWYAVGRDYALEKQLAQDLRDLQNRR